VLNARQVTRRTSGTPDDRQFVVGFDIGAFWPV
jgi:hypothetical protein